MLPIGKCEGLLRRLSILRLLPLKLVVLLGIRCKHMGSPAQVNTGGHRALHDSTTTQRSTSGAGSLEDALGIGTDA